MNIPSLKMDWPEVPGLCVLPDARLGGRPTRSIHNYKLAMDYFKFLKQMDWIERANPGNKSFHLNLPLAKNNTLNEVRFKAFYDTYCAWNACQLNVGVLPLADCATFKRAWLTWFKATYLEEYAAQRNLFYVGQGFKSISPDFFR